MGMITETYRIMGEEAFRRDIVLRDNPMEEGTDQHDAWDEGWRNAQAGWRNAQAEVRMEERGLDPTLTLAPEEKEAVGRLSNSRPFETPVMVGIVMRKSGFPEDRNPYIHLQGREEWSEGWNLADKEVRRLREEGALQLKSRPAPRPEDHPLHAVFTAAIGQAMHGKGQRHGGCQTPFLEQPWVHYAKMHGRGFLTGQAAKKLEEAASKRKGEPFATEMYGAMVYCAMAILHEKDETTGENDGHDR